MEKYSRALLLVALIAGSAVSAAADTTWSWDFTGSDAAEQLADFKKKAQPTYARVSMDYLILKANPDKGYEGLSTATPAGTDGDRHRKCGFKVVPPKGARVKSFTLEVANPEKNGLLPLGVIADLNKTYSPENPTNEGSVDYGVIFAARCYYNSFFSCSIGACYAAPYFSISKAGEGGGYASNAYKMDNPINQTTSEGVSLSRYNLTKAKYEVERIAETEAHDGMTFEVVVTLTSKLDGQSTTCPYTVYTGSQTGNAERQVKLDSESAKAFIPAAGFGFHVYQTFDSSAAVIQKFSVTFEGGEGEGEGEGEEGEGGEGEEGEGGEERDPEPTNAPPFSLYMPIDKNSSSGSFLIRATPLKLGAEFVDEDGNRPRIIAFKRTERKMKDGSFAPYWRIDFENVFRGVAYALCSAPSAETPKEEFVPVTNETENASSASNPMPECEQTTYVVIHSDGDVRETDNRYADQEPAPGPVYSDIVLALQGWEGEYDEQEHKATVTRLEPSDAILTWSANGGAFTSKVPSQLHAGKMTVRVRAEKPATEGVIFNSTTATAQVVVGPAANAWVVEPSLTTNEWTTDGPTATLDKGRPRFGTVEANYTTATLPKTAGDYKATFAVAATDDWSPTLTKEIPFKVVKAGGDEPPEEPPEEPQEHGVYYMIGGGDNSYTRTPTSFAKSAAGKEWGWNTDPAAKTALEHTVSSANDYVLSKGQSLRPAEVNAAAAETFLGHSLILQGGSFIFKGSDLGNGSYNENDRRWIEIPQVVGKGGTLTVTSSDARPYGLRGAIEIAADDVLTISAQLATDSTKAMFRDLKVESTVTGAGTIKVLLGVDISKYEGSPSKSILTFAGDMSGFTGKIVGEKPANVNNAGYTFDITGSFGGTIESLPPSVSGRTRIRVNYGGLADGETKGLRVSSATVPDRLLDSVVFYNVANPGAANLPLLTVPTGTAANLTAATVKYSATYGGEVTAFANLGVTANGDGTKTLVANCNGDAPEPPPEEPHQSHNWVETSRTNPTCVKAGEVKYACSCGATKSETLAATGKHTYGTDGLCTVCGAKDPSHENPEDPPDEPPSDEKISIANYFILPIPAQDVTGQPVTPKLHVAQTYYGTIDGSGKLYLTNGVELVEGRDYTVAVELCRGNLNDWSKTGSFRARAIVTGCGNYKGVISNTFTLANAEFRRTNILFEEEDTWTFFTKYYSQNGNVMTYIDKNKNGEVSYEEAAAVTSLPRISKAGEGVLGVKSSHDSFAFINFFPNVTRFANYCFMNVVHPNFVTAEVGFPNLQTLSGGQQGGGNTAVYYSSVAFEGCNFRRVNNLGNIPELSYSTFFNNPMIESLVIPPTCTNLVEKSIERTARMYRVDVPEQVRAVGHLCFFYDGSLYKRVHLYGEGAPKNRKKLVVFHGLTPPSLKNTQSVFSVCWVFIPDEAWDAYINTPGWSQIHEDDQNRGGDGKILYKLSDLERFYKTYYPEFTF